MGKKKKNKSLYKKNVQPFISENRVLIAALGGAVAGIALANILGSEKAKQIVGQIGDTAKGITDKIRDNVEGHLGSSERSNGFKSQKRANQVEKQPA